MSVSDDQEIIHVSLQRSTPKAEGPDNKQGFHLTPILICTVGVLCVILAAIIAKYCWMKLYIYERSDDKSGNAAGKAKQFQRLLNGQTLCPENKNENVYDELDEHEMDVDSLLKGVDKYRLH